MKSKVPGTLHQAVNPTDTYLIEIGLTDSKIIKDHLYFTTSDLLEFAYFLRTDTILCEWKIMNVKHRIDGNASMQIASYTPTDPPSGKDITLEELKQYHSSLKQIGANKKRVLEVQRVYAMKVLDVDLSRN